MPKDLNFSGDEEVFTATVTYDTKDLFGKVEAKCTIRVQKPEQNRP